MIVVETNNELKKFTAKLDQYDSVKAFVVWDETELPESVDPQRFFLWKDFMQLGQD